MASNSASERGSSVFMRLPMLSFTSRFQPTTCVFRSGDGASGATTLQQHTTATPQQHHSNTTATPQQHHSNTTATPQQHHSNTTATPQQQHSNTTQQHTTHTTHTTHTPHNTTDNNHNNNTIWGGSVLTGEEPPPHSGELNRALPQASGPTQSQLSRSMSSGRHISMEHRLRRKQLNSDTNASNKTYLKEIQEK